MTFEEMVSLWNLHSRNYLKRHRLIAPLASNKLLMARFESALENGINQEIATQAILEVKHFIDTDTFWGKRRKKQGIPWFFQERKSDQTPNWCWFYEHRLDRIEEEEEKTELQNNVFQFDKTGEELP